MSNNFIPHYSALPEERYLVEVNVYGEPPIKPNSANYRNHHGKFNSAAYESDVYNWQCNTDIHTELIAQLKKYPMPQMPVEWKDGRVVIENVDFRLQQHGEPEQTPFGDFYKYIAVPITSPSVVEEGDLRPCPFCSEPAEINQTGKMELTVRCTVCHIGLTQKVLRKSLDWLRGVLIESWNKRK